MSANAYACRMLEENYPAIRSEYPAFDLDEVRAWVEEHGVGYFIRDEGSKQYDCSYMNDVAFHRLYMFYDFKPKDIFHRITRL